MGDGIFVFDGHAHLSSQNVYPYKELMLENFVEKKLVLKKELGVTQSPTTDLMCHSPLRYHLRKNPCKIKSLKVKKLFSD